MSVRSTVIACGCVLWVCPGAWGQTATQESPTQEQLKKWLEQYPQADADRNGVLTREEAEAYRSRLRAQQRRDAAQYRTEFTFATMTDGVRIALAVAYPRDCDPAAATHQWPAMLEMHGYPDSTTPRSPGDFGDRYVTVRASLRGAGASEGAIQAISQRNGMDGYELIEHWIVQQPWSNGRVALHGHSWGGLSAFMIAATNPPHLSAVAVSGLLDDIYRDIGRPGGVRNAGFPVDWLVNLYKPTGPFDSSEAARQARGLSAEAYQALLTARPPWDLERDVLWNSLVSATDLPEFGAASPGTFAGGIRAPIHIMHAYQDEQTGPSGLWLWSYIADDVPKRLVLSNGDHGDVGRFQRERLAWLDFWTLRSGEGEPQGFRDPAQRVQVYFDTPRKPNAVNRPLAAADFPLPQTRWTRYFLRAGRQLSTAPPAADEQGADAYSVSGGQPDAHIDGAHYLLACDEPLAVCGPIGVTFWATCTTVDTDFYVVLADVDSNGVIQLLQRGVLRGSHRAVDEDKSLSVVVDGQKAYVRPRHTHRDPRPLVPGQAYCFQVEVFPVGHVFRAGHQLALWISPPLSGDPVARHSDGRPAYRYESAMPPGTVRILRGPEYPSQVVLPVLPDLPPLGAEELPAGEQAGIFTFDK